MKKLTFLRHIVRKDSFENLTLTKRVEDERKTASNPLANLGQMDGEESTTKIKLRELCRAIISYVRYLSLSNIFRSHI